MTRSARFQPRSGADRIWDSYEPEQNSLGTALIAAYGEGGVRAGLRACGAPLTNTS